MFFSPLSGASVAVIFGTSGYNLMSEITNYWRNTLGELLTPIFALKPDMKLRSRRILRIGKDDEHLHDNLQFPGTTTGSLSTVYTFVDYCLNIPQ